MAYARRSGGSSRRKAPARKGRTSRAAAPRRTARGRAAYGSKRTRVYNRSTRGSTAGGRTIRIVVEQAPANAAARPEFLTPTVVRETARKAKF